MKRPTTLTNKRFVSSTAFKITIGFGKFLPILCCLMTKHYFTWAYSVHMFVFSDRVILIFQQMISAMMITCTDSLLSSINVFKSISYNEKNSQSINHWNFSPVMWLCSVRAHKNMIQRGWVVRYLLRIQKVPDCLQILQANGGIVT